jgi:PAS domain S-box-containing protein
MKSALETKSRLAHLGFWLAAAGVLVTALVLQQWLLLAFLPFLAAGYATSLLETRARERERDRFFNLSLDLFCVANKDGYFKRLNPAFTRILGWSIEEGLAKPFLDLVHPEDREATLREVRRQVAAGQNVLHFENRYRHKDGSWRVLAWVSVPQPGGYMYATARDVTEQHHTQAELQKAKDEADAANRAKSTFLATMSHEIRTPLNGMLGMLELLGMTQLDIEQRSTVEVVRKSGESLKRIIDDILEFSKIEAGRLEIRPEAASVDGVLAAVRGIYSGIASSKGLLLDHTTDPDISPAVTVDAVRLQQILNNFVSNALKFTSAGSISIAARLVERGNGVERVRFEVRDTGIGIPAEQQRGLFQPFVQADNDTTRRYGGTGLGLTISRRLADLMGGTIELQSEPGQGTTIALVLPLPVADPRDLPAVPQDSPLAVATGARRRRAPTVARAQAEGTLILLVDDHVTNRMVLARQLNVLGYAVETAENGAQALELWRLARYGMVIADCNMPLMDGYELARRIREIEAEQGMKRTPIVACTANALRGEAAICLAAGMDDYLAKPVRLIELQAKVSRWLPIPEAPAAQSAFPAIPLGAGAGVPSAPVDRSALAVISGGDAETEKGILRDFKRINDVDAAALERAIEDTDLREVSRASHRMKGVSWTIGAVGLAQACERLERASRAKDWPTIQSGMAAFHREMEHLNAYFDAL